MVDVHSGKAIRCRDCGEEWDDMPFDHNCPNPQWAETKEKPYGIVSWSVRIPAAIKHAKGLWLAHPEAITAGEAALAEALWARYCTAVLDSPVGTPDEEVPPELIKFCEKVEKLT